MFLAFQRAHDRAAHYSSSLFVSLSPNIKKDEKNPALHYCTSLYSTFHHCPHILSKGAFPQHISTIFPHLSTQFTYLINLYLPPKKIISCRENIGASPPQKSFNFRRYFQSPDLFPPFSIFLCLWMFSFYLLV